VLNLDDLWKNFELVIAYQSRRPEKEVLGNDGTPVPNPLYEMFEYVTESVTHDDDVVHLSKVFSGYASANKIHDILRRRAFFRRHADYNTRDKHKPSFRDCESSHNLICSLMYDLDAINKRFIKKEPKEDLSVMLRMLDCATGDRNSKEMYQFVNMTCYEWYLQHFDKFIKTPENVQRLLSGIAFFGHACDIFGSGSLEAYFYCVPVPWTTYRMITKKCQFEASSKPKNLFLLDKDLIGFYHSPNPDIVKQVDFVSKYRTEFRSHRNYNVADETGFFYKSFEARESVIFNPDFSQSSTPRVFFGFFDDEMDVSDPTDVKTCLQWYTQGTDKFEPSLYNFNLLSHSICFFGHILDIIGSGNTKGYFMQIPVSFSRYKAITKLCKFHPNRKQMGDSTF
jgi:hypothetical protein